jgi:hypothetical protein
MSGSESLLGMTFAGHRDSVSEPIGDKMESAIEDVLDKAGINSIQNETSPPNRQRGLKMLWDIKLLVDCQHNFTLVSTGLNCCCSAVNRHGHLLAFGSGNGSPVSDSQAVQV